MGSPEKDGGTEARAGGTGGSIGNGWGGVGQTMEYRALESYEVEVGPGKNSKGRVRPRRVLNPPLEITSYFSG